MGKSCIRLQRTKTLMLKNQSNLFMRSKCDETQGNQTYSSDLRARWFRLQPAVNVRFEMYQYATVKYLVL